MFARFFSGVAVIFGAAFALGFVLPDQTHVEREIVINAPSEKIYALVSDFNAWDGWSPLAETNPYAELSLSGGGVGQRMEWRSNHLQMASGTQEIVAMAEPARMVSRISVNDMGAADAAFTLVPTDDGGTKVIWSFDSNMRDSVPIYLQPVATYLGYFADPMLGPAYEQGLANLKRVAEAG